MTTSPSTIPKRPRRGRPPRIDTEKLLEVAREVFLEKGIRATTLEVAERAGVSEGAVFHRFKSKDVLFREAMRWEAENFPAAFTNILDSIDPLDMSEALTNVALRMIELSRVGIPLMMMTWSNPDWTSSFNSKDSCISPSGCSALHPSDAHREVMRSLLRRFAGYFEARMAEGKLRRMDGEILARCFMGTVHHYCMSEIILGSREDSLPEGMFVRGLVDLILHGSVADSAEPSLPPIPRRPSHG